MCTFVNSNIHVAFCGLLKFVEDVGTYEGVNLNKTRLFTKIYLQKFYGNLNNYLIMLKLLEIFYYEIN